MVTLDLAAAVYRIQAFGGRLRAEKMPQGDPISGDYHTVFLVEHAEVCRR